MAKERQRPISISDHARTQLDVQKQRYDQATGEKTDWGNFLGTVTLLGLAAVGIYKLVEATQRSAQSVDVKCAFCQETFVMAVPSGTARVIYTTCPECGGELVVNLGGNNP